MLNDDWLPSDENKQPIKPREIVLQVINYDVNNIELIIAVKPLAILYYDISIFCNIWTHNYEFTKGKHWKAWR